MNIDTSKTLKYIISFLLDEKGLDQFVYYGYSDKVTELSNNIKLVIIQSDFFDDNVYGTKKTLPETPFRILPESSIPFLYGESKLEYCPEGRVILYADLIASAFFMLSRYEEIIKPECRDQHGRFLAKDSVVFQQGYGMRPIVDEWGRYLRGLLRKKEVNVPEEKSGFRKIYLTHDVDVPFLFFRKEQIIKQWIKNLIHRGKRYPYSVFFNPENDPQYTFPKIIEKDTWLQNQYGKELVESIYFIIAAGSRKTKEYCNIKIKKFKKLVNLLFESGATIGLHVSYEAGTNPKLINREMKRLLKYNSCAVSKSRHHFLHWTEPEHIIEMEKAGITDDFSLEYADSVGFRVGTCKPYYFINPRTRNVNKVLEHPMEIMECTLDRTNYMGLTFNEAVDKCVSLIDTIYDYNGELVLLFHNPIWSNNTYYGKLYETLLEYLITKNNCKNSKHSFSV